MKVDLNESCLIVNIDGRSVDIAWDTIDSVFAYKQDQLVVDLIVTVFKFGDSHVEINEDFDGWKGLMDDLPRFLPNCREFSDWFTEVAFPAFEVKPTTIFKRLSAQDIQ